MTERHIARLRNLTRVLDDLVAIPGTNIRVGLDPLLGLIPGGGDVVGGLVASYAIIIASQLGAPPSVIARMLGNVLLDTLFGSIPLLGDIFDVGWKANRRNFELLQNYQEAPGEVRTRSRLGLAVALLVLLAFIVGIVWLAAKFIGWLAAQI